MQESKANCDLVRDTSNFDAVPQSEARSRSITPFARMALWLTPECGEADESDSEVSRLTRETQRRTRKRPHKTSIKKSVSGSVQT